MRDSISKNKVKKWFRKIPDINCWPPHTHTHKYAVIDNTQIQMLYLLMLFVCLFVCLLADLQQTSGVSGVCIQLLSGKPGVFS